jgi:diguanylate cyclase (GGDEF)-like protein/PAS domain S-box-containing protein
MKKTTINSEPKIIQKKIKNSVETKRVGLKNKLHIHMSDHYLLNHLLDYVPESIYFKDTESRFIRLSMSLAKSFGLESPQEAIGKTDYDFFSQEHARQAFEGEQEIIRTGRTLSIEEKETRPNLPDRWVLTTKMPIYNENREIIGTFGISRDITDRKLAEDNLRSQAHRLQNQIEEINLLQEQLKDQATHDSLTGLFNRRMMDQILSQQLENCKELNQEFVILVIDIDQFKRINDEFGHLVGDTILAEFGKCIIASTRSDDFSCRLGGDEILMAFQKMSMKEAKNKAEIIRKKLGAISVRRDDQKISATVSIGIASFPSHGITVNELINRADEALYIAKEKGRNQVVII